MSICPLRAGAHPALILLPALSLIIVVLCSCSRSREMGMEIRFGMSPQAPVTPIARNVQFYIHEVELLDTEGRAHAFRFTAAAPWQSTELGLVDLAGTNGHATLRGTVDKPPDGRFAGIRFVVGVPFDLNHANPLTASAPLDRSELFWTWQSGYKFLRIDLAVDGREWSFHLGSTGCSSASALRPPGAPCAQPNRMHVQLAGDPMRQTVRLDLGVLAAAARAANYMVCTGNYVHDPACAAPYAATALQAPVGVCSEAHCDGQKLWELE